MREIEAEDTIRLFTLCSSIFSSEEIRKEKIQVVCLTFSEIEISQFYPLSRERYESVNKYKY